MNHQNPVELYDEINARTATFALERGYNFSSAREKILRELVKMFQRFGDFYCPCQSENTAHTVCVCDEVRTGYVDDVGRCHCNLFVGAGASGARRLSNRTPVDR